MPSRKEELPLPREIKTIKLLRNNWKNLKRGFLRLRFFVEKSCTIFILLTTIIVGKQGKICYNIDILTKEKNINDGDLKNENGSTFRNERYYI